MARLRLRTRVQSEAFSYPGTGEIVSMPTCRLLIGLHFVAPTARRDWKPTGQIDQMRRFDAVVDTGAMLTNIPYDVWEPFASEIEWPSAIPAQNAVQVAGTSLTYQLGRVMLAAIDNENRWMEPAWTVARCWHFCENAPPPLLGLTSPFFMNNKRLRNAGPTGNDAGEKLPEWWLEDPSWWS